jgi:hypothetical protein
MIPSDVAGIFSRYFVVGFFLPVFFVLVVAAHLVGAAWTPSAYADAKGGTQIVILGGAGLLGGLLLLSVDQYVVRFFAGYPLQEFVAWWGKTLSEEGRIFERLSRRAIRHRPEWEELDTAAKKRVPGANWRLNRYFPFRKEEVMPTRLGNAIRAFESHPYKAFGLDGPPNWPRVEALVTDNEREALAEALSSFSFLLHWTLLAPPAAVYVVFCGVFANTQRSWFTIAILFVVTVAAGCLITWTCYRAAVGAAVTWGAVVRSAFALHRLKLYDQLGLKRPETAAEERVIAKAANRSASFGEELVGTVRNNSGEGGKDDAG